MKLSKSCKKKNKNNDKTFRYIVIFILITSLFLGIGYAQMSTELVVEGDATLNKQEGIVITNAELVSSSENASAEITNYVQTTLTTDINLGIDSLSSVTFLVTVQNTGSRNYKFEDVYYDDAETYNGTFYSNPNIVPSIEGNTIQLNGIIKGGETKSFYVTYSYRGGYDGNSVLKGIVNFNFEEAKTFYIQLPPDWEKGVTTYLYNDATSTRNATWPGKPAVLEDSNLNIYSYTMDDNEDISMFNHIIFSNQSSSSDDSTRQTVDIETSFSILGDIFVPELYHSDQYTRIFVKSDVASLYLWSKDSNGNDIKDSNGNTITNAAWPGVTLTDKVSGQGFTALIDRNLYNMMIVKTSNNQTADLNVNTYQDLTYQVTGSKKQNISRLYYFGSWHDYTAWTKSEYAAWREGDYLKFIEAKNVGY